MSSAAAPKEELLKTALHATHRALGARMVPFGGWEMPVEYSGIIAEHNAVRTQVGLFDVSHMGRFEVKGRAALPLIQKVTCNDASKLENGQAQYSGLMNERAGFVDDLVVHKVADENYLLCVNASRRAADWEWISKNNQAGAELRNISDDYSQIAIQGPRSVAVLQPMTDANLSAIRYYWFTRGKVADAPCWIARTGYTGEDGFEIYLPVAETERLWKKLLEDGKSEGIVPCGLGARNTLRLEAGMALYGHELDEQTTALEANLGWICKLDKGPFLGSTILQQQKQQGVPRVLAGFKMIDRQIARDDAPVFSSDGSSDKLVGKVTSGSYVPFLKQNIGLAYLPPELAKIGTRISIQIRNNMAAAEVVKPPFYKRPKT